MIHLQNRELRVDVLEPTVDAERLGARYCWGGYVWQVHDVESGPLLAGPEWPNATPTPFNGQGLPEAFRHRTRAGDPLTWREGIGVAIGAGIVAAESDGVVNVTTPCAWTLKIGPDRLTFATSQVAAGFGYELTRELRLETRDLISSTELRNTGPDPLSLEWFAHPFFALTAGGACVQFPPGTTLPENPGFALTQSTLSFKRRFAGQDDGQFSLLGLPRGTTLHATINHPILSAVEFFTSFVPNECPIWANENTFSVEPYLNLHLAPGERKQWKLHYRFGGPSRTQEVQT